LRGHEARYCQIPCSAKKHSHSYLPTDASGQPTVAAPGGTEGLGTLVQGYQEQSNVSVVNEFINLIAAQRGYEANSKVVKAADQMYQQVNNIAQ
jgi:flagellar basal-body rod protein FlgG